MATAQDVITRARDLINDTASSFVSTLRWSNAELLEWITDGQREIVRQLPEANSVTDAFDVVGGISRQRLRPENAYRLIRVEANGAGAFGGGASTLAIRKSGGDLGIISLVATLDTNSPRTFTGWTRFATVGPTVSLKSFVAGDIVVASVESYTVLTLDLNVNGTDGPQMQMPDAGEWFFWAITIANVASHIMITAKWAYPEDTSFDPARTQTTVFRADSSVADLEITSVDLGASHITGPVDTQIDFAQARQWTALLSDAEILAEKNSALAVRTANLFSDNPLAGVSDTSDASGNSREATLSANLFFDTDGPPNG